MARLSRGKKRERKQAAHAAAPAAAPIEVRVPGAGPGAGGASVGGVPVAAEPGEEIQRAVLDRLHRMALACGRPVHATVHDDRIGYVVPLRVDPDGSSHCTAEPVRTGPPSDAAPAGTGGVPPAPAAPAPAPPPAAAAPGSAPEPARPPREEPTRLPRPAPEPVRDAVPAFPPRTAPGPRAPAEPVPPSEPRAVPEPPRATPPGTVLPPTGRFGPPPAMEAPVPTDTPAPAADGKSPGPAQPRRPQPRTGPASARRAGASPALDRGPAALDPDPDPAPARGFDAVAEAVLDDGPRTGPGEAPALLAEPVARINEAVRDGRIETAAALAERTVRQASHTLGPEHPEVLRLRELDAYIAYLAGDPVRALRLSLELAGIHRRAGDAEAAYGNVHSAATAWRAVREPLLGLELGGELIGLWSELAAEGGPAAADAGQLESARARMDRLTARARG
ncbi:tetratricopeptide repeat protein [Streptomyces sp. NPDC052701]|uniref:tetratricopeptide repeat protein n=1 Tax=Streptomyces sp. NPDC052701 TaxID=3155533 RepID=UPI00341CDC47